MVGFSDLHERLYRRDNVPSSADRTSFSLSVKILMLTELSIQEILMLAIGAAGIGVSKSGFPGISMLHVVLYAFVFGAKDSTGVLLPMLVVGDCCAIYFFGRKAVWHQVRRLLPPTLVGILIGWQLMDRLNEDLFRVLVGFIILALTIVQVVRMWRPTWFDQVPHQRWFAVLLGLLAGLTTMMANAAGPVVALYLLAVSLPKWELIGTTAWLFLVLNLLKLPLSFQLGLITPSTLAVGAAFAIAIPLGILSGRWLVSRVSQKLFNGILLAFTGIAALRLIGLF
ncbi:sulfite exporter TauE/SafE family protein [Crateriforma conspicua]|nr:sulfite exporter TauE/SafE family protein [Crateriforma conspicua]